MLILIRMDFLTEGIEITLQTTALMWLMRIKSMKIMISGAQRVTLMILTLLFKIDRKVVSFNWGRRTGSVRTR